MSQYEFLYKEYEECFTQQRFHDERIFRIVKFVITISSSVGVILLALFAFLRERMAVYFLLQGLLCSVVCVSLIMLLLVLLQNRIYIVFVARQLNAIRKYFLENHLQEFTENQMHLWTSYPAFKLFSNLAIMLLGITFFTVVYLVGAVISFELYIWGKVNVVRVFVIGILFFLLEVAYSFIYLKIQDR